MFCFFLNKCFFHCSLLGETLLFVVSHPHGQSQVELFVLMEEDLVLIHLKTFKHELLYRCVVVAEFLFVSPYTIQYHATFYLSVRGLTQSGRLFAV